LSSCAPSDPTFNLSTKTSRFVSRGGDKLRGALDHFHIDPTGLVCMDVGSSTGGFTDCLLKAGAKKVIAVDVGYGLIDYGLRNDPRVELHERTNFRHFDPLLLTEKPELITIDVSFISLAKILPKIVDVLKSGGRVLAMVKPQFEGTPKEVPGGFVRDETTRQAILARVRAEIFNLGFHLEGSADSVVKGRKGNQETFFHLKV
jgi:23S rRNA (cytidine1920-2'-O)/16S rRNA (cytidine1409-2'-O)-methyltransferase